MRRSLILLGATTAIAAASAVSELNLPDTVPQDTRRLLQRQTPGTPQYDCHANCGTSHTLFVSTLACVYPPSLSSPFSTSSSTSTILATQPVLPLSPKK